ncbi:MAG: PIG-L deacetylase family protein [Candidatus Bruticola sp.]
MEKQLQGGCGVCYIPDGTEEAAAWARVTHLALGAHPDDIEFMAWHGILEGFGYEDKFFAGVTLTDGGGSSRIGAYAQFSDEQMRAVRLQEQKKAAHLGNYAALAALGYTSAQVRLTKRTSVKNDIKTIVKAARPRVIFTHNLADRHKTHLAAALLTIEALRELGPDYYPEEFYGGEVWRSLDWLPWSERRSFNVGTRPNISEALMALYDSQISGGKNYHRATKGRREANATYADAYAPDEAELLELFMDLKPLLDNPSLTPADYLSSLIDKFKAETVANLSALS